MSTESSLLDDEQSTMGGQDALLLRRGLGSGCVRNLRDSFRAPRPLGLPASEGRRLLLPACHIVAARCARCKDDKIKLGSGRPWESRLKAVKAVMIGRPSRAVLPPLRLRGQLTAPYDYPVLEALAFLADCWGTRQCRRRRLLALVARTAVRVSGPFVAVAELQIQRQAHPV